MVTGISKCNCNCSSFKLSCYCSSVCLCCGRPPQLSPQLPSPPSPPIPLWLLLAYPNQITNLCTGVLCQLVTGHIEHWNAMSGEGSTSWSLATGSPVLREGDLSVGWLQQKDQTGDDQHCQAEDATQWKGIRSLRLNLDALHCDCSEKWKSNVESGQKWNSVLVNDEQLW